MHVSTHHYDFHLPRAPRQVSTLNQDGRGHSTLVISPPGLLDIDALEVTKIRDSPGEPNISSIEAACNISHSYCLILDRIGVDVARLTELRNHSIRLRSPIISHPDTQDKCRPQEPYESRDPDIAPFFQSPIGKT